MHAGNEAAELALQEYSNRYGQKMLAEMGLDPRFQALQGKPRLYSISISSVFPFTANCPFCAVCERPQMRTTSFACQPD